MSLETANEPRGRVLAGRGARVAPAQPKPVARAVALEGEAIDAEVAACLDAANRCACVVAGFFVISPDALKSKTRGSPRDAFPRQVWMAGLVSQLGFAPDVVGAAIGRDKSTVEHACRIVEGLRGGMSAHDLIALLGEDGCRDYLGGDDMVIEWRDAKGRAVDIEHGDDTRDLVVHVVSGGKAVADFVKGAEGLIDDAFASFQFVAVRGAAYCEARDKLMRERGRLTP